MHICCSYQKHCPSTMCFQELWWPKQRIFLLSSTEEVGSLFWWTNNVTWLFLMTIIKRNSHSLHKERCNLNCIVLIFSLLDSFPRGSYSRGSRSERCDINRTWVCKLCKLEPCLFREMRSQSHVTLLLRLGQEDPLTILLVSRSHSGIMDSLGVDIHRRPNDNHKSSPPKSAHSS